MRSFRRIAFQALILSFLAHIIIFNLFSFRIPLKDTPFKPFVNFLGSFLESYDTQSTKKNPPTRNRKDEQFLSLSHQQENHPHVKAETPRALLFLSLPASTKKTLPYLKIDPSSASTSTEQGLQDNEESFSHTPLKLPEHDRY